MLRTLAPAVAAFLILSCGNQLTIPINVPIPERTVEGNAFLGALNGLIEGIVPPLSVDISQSQEFERHDVDRIESIRMTALTLELTENSDEENFNFLNRIVIQATDESGEHSVEVARIDPVPSDVQRIEFDVTDEELNDIFGTDFNLRFDANGQPPA